MMNYRCEREFCLYKLYTGLVIIYHFNILKEFMAPETSIRLEIAGPGLRNSTRANKENNAI